MSCAAARPRGRAAAQLRGNIVNPRLFSGDMRGEMEGMEGKVKPLPNKNSGHGRDLGSAVSSPAANAF